MVREHLAPRFADRRLDALSADDMATLVRELRAEGKSEATISVTLAVVGYVFKFAARRLGWTGAIPTSLMLKSERPKLSQSKRRPIFTGEQLEQTLAAAHEPFRTLFVVAAPTGARVSELCGLTWADVRLVDLGDAEIDFGFQVDRHGNRRPSKTDGSARTIPIPAELASILARHKRTARYVADADFVFVTGTGPDGHSSSATCRAPCAKLKGGLSTGWAHRPSLPFTTSTMPAIRCLSRAAPSRQCIRSDTRSPLAHCWRARAWTRSRSSWDTGTEPSHEPSTSAKSRTPGGA
jgi:integrase